MVNRSIALSAFALTALALAGCASYQDDPAPAAPVTTTAPVIAATPAAPATPASPAALATLKPGTYRPGAGILESIGLVTLPASAAAGATAAPAPGPFRLTLRMDDGTVQTLIQDTRALLVGDRLQITSDGRLIRP
jgi:hypothetical protein